MAACYWGGPKCTKSRLDLYKLVHNKHGDLVSRECYIHIWMDASPYGIGDSGGNFSDKYQEDKKQIYKVIL